LERVHAHKHNPSSLSEAVDVRHHAFRMNFIGANTSQPIRGLDKLSYYRNYFRGNNPNQWSSRVGVYQKVEYSNLYPGIDALFYSSESNFKYDFIVRPGANPNQILMKYEGLDGLEKIGENLALKNSVVQLQELAPFAYQFINGELVQVPCYFIVDGAEVRFDFPTGYNSNFELVIDPTLIFATMTGSTSDNWGTSATNDANGNLVGCGMAFATNYPTTLGAFQESFGGEVTDMSIIKYNVDGTNALFSTYIGGASTEFPHSSIVNQAGEIIILGTTSSANFPMTPQSYDSSFDGGSNVTIVPTINYPNGSDIVVVVLSADGASLNAATYLGGSGNDGLNTSTDLSFNYADGARGEVNLDSNENIYITSCTESNDFPLTNGAFQQGFGGGNQDGVVVKLNSDLSNVLWSTYLGGDDDDAVYSSKVDANNNLYVTGGTNSNDFPKLGGTLNNTFQGGAADGFISHLSGSNGDLINTTFLGTSAFDQSYLLDLDADGNVYVVGQSVGGYPVSGNVYTDPGTTQFLHKLSPDLNTTIFSTVFGNGDEVNISPTAFLVDDCQRIYVSGWGGDTQSAGNGSPGLVGNTLGMLVTPDAIQSTTDGSDFYIIQFAPDATAVEYASFFGSTDANEHVDGGTSRFDKSGVIYQAVCAGCGGNSFPTTPGVWSEENGSGNCNLGAFKFAFEQDEVVAQFSTVLGDCSSLTVEFENESLGGESYMWDFGDGNSSEEESPTYTYATGGSYTVQLSVMNPSTCTFEIIDVVVNVLDVSSDTDSGTISGGGIACATAGNAITTSGDGSFSLADGLESATDYFIIAAIANANGEVINDDECTSFSPPVEAYWLNPVDIEFENFCDAGTGEFSVTVFASGGLPELDGSEYAISSDVGSSFNLEPEAGATIALGQFDGLSYSFSAVDNAGCSGSKDGPIISCIKTPIELISFSGESRNDGNLLSWTTATETDNDFFKIQRSADGSNWQTIGQIDGAGNSINEISYQFLDQELSQASYYYRLQSVDFNAYHENSAIIYLSREENVIVTFNVYPSIVDDYVVVEMATSVQQAQIILSDAPQIELSFIF